MPRGTLGEPRAERGESCGNAENLKCAGGAAGWYIGSLLGHGHGAQKCVWTVAMQEVAGERRVKRSDTRAPDLQYSTRGVLGFSSVNSQK